MSENNDADRAAAVARQLRIETNEMILAYSQALQAAYQDAWFAARDLLEADPDQAEELAHIKAELDEARHRAAWVLHTSRAITMARFVADDLVAVLDTELAKSASGWTELPDDSVTAAAGADNTTVGVSGCLAFDDPAPVRRSLWGRLFGRWFR